MSANPSCPVCGRPVPQSSGRGRPRLYHPRCQQAGRLLVWLESEITELAPRLTPDAKAHFTEQLRGLTEQAERADYDPVVDPAQASIPFDE